MTIFPKSSWKSMVLDFCMRVAIFTNNLFHEPIGICTFKIGIFLIFKGCSIFEKYCRIDNFYLTFILSLSFLVVFNFLICRHYFLSIDPLQSRIQIVLAFNCIFFLKFVYHQLLHFCSEDKMKVLTDYLWHCINCESGCFYSYFLTINCTLFKDLFVLISMNASLQCRSHCLISHFSL